MKIIFHENQLSYRGTSNAIFDYAFYNQELLGNESVIVYNKENKNNFEPAINKFKSKFKVVGYSQITELENIVDVEKAALFYALKAGHKDGIMVSNCKTAIHSVFKNFEPHGDVYAYVSRWLAEEMTGGKYPYVPHIVKVAETSFDLRHELGIPKDAIVFGRHGGHNTFDLKFVKSVVKKIARSNKNVYFLFLGTDSFVFKTIFTPYKNVIFLPVSIDEIYKVKFINTCDAYLHARKQGESFGIAIGEFSIMNKPTITWGNSKEKAHLDILGDKALIYHDERDLTTLVENFTPNPLKDWDAYSEEFSPKKVMEKFRSVFID